MSVQNSFWTMNMETVNDSSEAARGVYLHVLKPIISDWKLSYSYLSESFKLWKYYLVTTSTKYNPVWEHKWRPTDQENSRLV